MKSLDINISIPFGKIKKTGKLFMRFDYAILLFILTVISYSNFINYSQNGLGLSYNDARSHLDIGRRVVEGLKPGMAQLGSVWLPLPHILMIPTIWNDFMWHTGLSGAIQSMVSYVGTGLIIYYYLKRLRVHALGRSIAVLIFAINLNVLYMQSTAMTELLLIGTMTAASYELLVWYQKEKLTNLITASFWVMLATLIRYDGWFLFLVSSFLLTVYSFKKAGFKAAEARFLFFSTVAGLGIVLWFLWNLLIFKDPLYFIFGPYSAYAQQSQLAQAGILTTKGNILYSLKVYFYALAFNSYTFLLLLGALGSIVFFLDKKIKISEKLAAVALFAPFFFNILALYMGQSVLFVQGLAGDTWFNIRYGLMMMPAVAIFSGYLVQKSRSLKYVLVGLILAVSVLGLMNRDAVTIDDARVGSSQKNVSEVSGWLNKNAKDKDGFVLISAASHDAIIFSSGLPMSRFIHEGTGAYWTSATSAPDRWARWIIMRTNDVNDSTFKFLMKNKALSKYNLVGKYPFADIYEIKPEYIKNLNEKLDNKKNNSTNSLQSNQKYISSDVSVWLQTHTNNKEGFILASSQSNEPIIFSSGLPMRRFIIESTGEYWKSAIAHPQYWATWIVISKDTNDAVNKNISQLDLAKYYDKELVGNLGDIYQLKQPYLAKVNTKPVLDKQK